MIFQIVVRHMLQYVWLLKSPTILLPDIYYGFSSYWLRWDWVNIDMSRPGLPPRELLSPCSRATSLPGSVEICCLFSPSPCLRPTMARNPWWSRHGSLNRGSEGWGGRSECDRHKSPREVRYRPPWLWCAIDSEREAVSSSLSMELADQLTKLVLLSSASRTRHMVCCTNALSRRLYSCVCTSGSRSH